MLVSKANCKARSSIAAGDEEDKAAVAVLLELGMMKPAEDEDDETDSLPDEQDSTMPCCQN